MEESRALRTFGRDIVTTTTPSPSPPEIETCEEEDDDEGFGMSFVGAADGDKSPENSRPWTCGTKHAEAGIAEGES
jgi:hypothetical protein